MGPGRLAHANRVAHGALGFAQLRTVKSLVDTVDMLVVLLVTAARGAVRLTPRWTRLPIVLFLSGRYNSGLFTLFIN
jgi:hypothetical protein